ncbi:MAG: hypothetical protein LPJ94_05005, partial [Thauera sp.]|nr:hypothetical protein [Thauera sp.]
RRTRLVLAGGRPSHEFLYRVRPDSAMRRAPSTGNLTTVAAHPHSAAGSGASPPSPIETPQGETP